jgi:hypothetical protein
MWIAARRLAGSPGDRRGRASREAGVALLVVLLILLVVAAASASFIWFMNQQQARAGARFRSVAAFALAEAGVHRAMAILESTAPDGRPGRSWRPQAFSETTSLGPLQGRYTVSIANGPGDALFITSTGEVGGLARRLRARVHLASPALLVAVYGTSIVRLEGPPTATFILPYGAGIGDRPWVHIASGQGIWIANSETLLNKSGVAFRTAPGPVDAPEGPGSATSLPRPGPLRLMLASGADLRIDEFEQQITADQLRTVGIDVAGVELRAGPLPVIPAADRTYFRAQATANAANARLNRAAGRYAGDGDLERKRDSVYTAGQFTELLDYLRSLSQPPSLQGIIYVTGGFALDGQRLRIDDGTLVVEDTVRLDQGASLELVHSGTTRTLPGLVLLDEAQCIVTGEASLRVHGLVYANRVMDVGRGARVDVVGSVLGDDPGFSFVNSGGTVVIRYDPAVLGTPGLRTSDDQPVIAWVAAWEELP